MTFSIAWQIGYDLLSLLSLLSLTGDQGPGSHSSALAFRPAASALTTTLDSMPPIDQIMPSRRVQTRLFHLDAKRPRHLTSLMPA
jgi:hypothetical protein